MRSRPAHRGIVVSSLLQLLGRAVVLTGAAVLFAVGYNALRPNGIDLVASTEYEIYVPCPETQVEVAATTTRTASSREVLYVDARPASDFERRHIEGAVSFPYPLLDGVLPEGRVRELTEQGRAVVTYDDGGRAVLAEMMAAALTEAGVPEVTRLEGGLAAWLEHGGETEGRQDHEL